MAETDVDNPLSARLAFSFVSGGVGLSLLTQGEAPTAGRLFLLNHVPLPLWTYAVPFLVLSLWGTYAAVRDKGRQVEISLVWSGWLWAAWAFVYLLPVLEDFRHAVFVGPVVFLFIALMCSQGAKIETQRRLGVGAWAPREMDPRLSEVLDWLEEERMKREGS